MSSLNETFEFITAFFAEKPEDWLIEIRPISEPRIPGLAPRAFALTQKQAAIDFSLQCNERGADVYFGVAPRSRWPEARGRGGGKAEVDFLVALWADLDPPKGESLSMGEARDRLGAVALPPTATVVSGHGLHAYWFLTDPLFVGDLTNERNAKQLLKRLANAVGGDPNVADIARVMRLPGTLNLKPLRQDPQAKPLPCYLRELHTDRRYCLEELEKYLPPPPVEAVVVPPRPEPRGDHLERILASNPMPLVAEKLGLGIVRGNPPLCPCPFHDDRDPSLALYPDHGHCFGCEWHGDPIDFVRSYCSVGFREAVALLASWANLPPLSVRRAV